MADKQILVTGSEDAPAGYTVPNTVEIIPKAVNCTLDGTGASGNFVPLLQVISDGGVIVAESPGATVTAGGSVKQSWFQGALGASQALSTQIVRAWGLNTTTQSVSAGTTKSSAFTTVRTSDSNYVSWSTGVSTNDTITLHGVGWAQLACSCSWPSGTKVDFRINSPSGYNVFAQDGFNSMSGFATDLILGLPTLMNFAWIDTTSATTTTLHVGMTNADASASGPDTAYVGIMFYPGLSL